MAFSGTEALGLSTLTGGTVLAHDSGNHGWADYSAGPYHPTSSSAGITDHGTYYLHDYQTPMESHDISNPINTSMQIVGNDRGFGAIADVQIPIKMGNQGVTTDTYLSAGGLYNHPQILGGGMMVTIPIK